MVKFSPSPGEEFYTTGGGLAASERPEREGVAFPAARGSWYVNCRNDGKNSVGGECPVTKRRVFCGWAALLILFLAPGATPAQTAPPKAPSGTAVKSAATVKVTKMSATARVLEISETAMKVERSVKGAVEVMEFLLEKPAPRIAVGDKVRIIYVAKDGRLAAVKVSKATSIDPKKAKKEARAPVLAIPAPPGSGK